jgi:hypothetical protein
MYVDLLGSRRTPSDVAVVEAARRMTTETSRLTTREPDDLRVDNF